MSTIREQIMENEKILLSPYAQFSFRSKGRKVPEKECDIRTPYQRDRDRILHSKSFRRLKRKTQVFIAPEGDHYRTRMTHTLEVTQIARTIARALRLNEDLTEAIGMGHDLGHTPFGHAGERALALLNPSGFTHFEQGVRVVEHLERDLKGLNLTWEVVDGIRHHTRGEWRHTLEGQVVRYADRIAYINHDIEDAISAGILREEDLPKDCTDFLGHYKSQRITTLIESMVKNSGASIAMDSETQKYFDRMHDYMYRTVYVDPIAKAEESKVGKLIEELYKYYGKDPARMPKMYQRIAEEEGIDQAVTDYIQGMSDNYASSTFEDIFIPRAWKVK
jgi:dGTPase